MKSTKSQSTIEFALIFLFAFIIIGLLTYLIGIISIEIVDTKNSNELDDFASTITNEAAILQKVQGGYHRKIEIPEYLMKRFNVSISGNYLILYPLEFDPDSPEPRFYELAGQSALNLTNESGRIFITMQKDFDQSSQSSLVLPGNSKFSSLIPVNCSEVADDSCSYVNSLFIQRHGFAETVIGGGGGNVYYVSTLASSGAGSLKEGLESPDPLWIKFNVNGTIVHDQINIQSYKTIDARGADITLKSEEEIVDTSSCIGTVKLNRSNSPIFDYLPVCVNPDDSEDLIPFNEDDCRSFILKSSVLTCFYSNPLVFFNTISPKENLIITNINFSSGGVDALTLAHNSSNIWIHKNSFGIYGDGAIDMTQGATNITISNNHFKSHDKLMIIGLVKLSGKTYLQTEEIEGNIRVTLDNNFFENIVQRIPRLSWGTVHIYNNYFKAWESYTLGLGNKASAFLEQNIFEPNTQTRAILQVDGSVLNESGEPLPVGAWCDNGNSFEQTSGGIDLEILDSQKTLDCSLVSSFYDYDLEIISGSSKTTIESNAGRELP